MKFLVLHFTKARLQHGNGFGQHTARCVFAVSVPIKTDGIVTDSAPIRFGAERVSVPFGVLLAALNQNFPKLEGRALSRLPLRGTVTTERDPPTRSASIF